MKVAQGHSYSTDSETAVAEATQQIPGDLKPDIILLFSSTKQEPQALLEAVAKRFKGVLIAGCTTAGEILDEHHSRGGLVLSAIQSPEIRWSVRALTDLQTADGARATEVADQLFSDLGISRDQLDPQKHFCMTFLDGLSLREEQTVSLMADALEGLPLLGGSSGDDLGFKKTYVFANNQALANAGVFVLAESKTPFEIIKHQHYKTTPYSLVITKADVPTRRVFEMDGYPAIEAYANALGIKPEEVTSDITFMNPLTFVCNGEIYVRSIQRVESDGSIIFYCGIEEGMVLSVGGHEDMGSALARDLDSFSLQSKQGNLPDLFIACNCILRALESDKRGLHEQLGNILKQHAKHVIGFDTYGEQLNGLHINQTLVGIALHGEGGGA